jgi:hypothetical protein
MRAGQLAMKFDTRLSSFLISVQATVHHGQRFEPVRQHHQSDLGYHQHSVCGESIEVLF